MRCSECGMEFYHLATCSSSETQVRPTATVDRGDLDLAWSIVVVYASRLRESETRETIQRMADRLREALDG